MRPLDFDRSLCAGFADASSREWLETNGIGGFASSTILGLNTRRYHALLVAATRPPVGRLVLLSKLEETLVAGDVRYELSANQYPGAVHPNGQDYLSRFRLDPFPIFTYELDGIELEKSVFLVHGENTAVVRYEFKSNRPGCYLEVRPLIAFRDYHSTSHANSSINGAIEQTGRVVTIAPYADLPNLRFSHNAHAVEATGSWYYNFEYERERERGLDYREDLYSPFLLRFDCALERKPAIVASLVDRPASQAEELRAREIGRRTCLVQGAPDPILANAADQFVVDRGKQKSIIAGYPWFSDWGRDTMISLPGLALVTGCHDEARAILLAFAECIDQGMLPNRFPDAGEKPEYNTVDATLWMFHAVHELLRYTGDFGFVREHLYARLVDVIRWHERGTRYGIKLDSDGLLRAGEPGIQLTWMDARVGDWVVTPRHGKPVEIQALWYNALCVMEQLATVFEDHDRSRTFAMLALRARETFPRAFWNAAESCLHDVLEDSGPDAAIRPNQIFAVSLPYSMLDAPAALAVVEAVERELLTPYGLRTLSPRDSRYRARFDGDMASRDAAYHQGTVWPWLIGPFLTARVKVHGNSAEARAAAGELLRPLQRHLSEAGLGQIAEVFDGDAPHRPGGCIAQAWSVAEVLRARIEVVEGREPEALALRARAARIKP